MLRAYLTGWIYWDDKAKGLYVFDDDVYYKVEQRQL